MSVEFVDTTILVYAHDVSAGEKRTRARQLVDGLLTTNSGAVSIQVLQELFVTLTRKIPQPLSVDEARAIVADLASWRVMEPTRQDVLGAIDAALRWQVSFWDAMILHAASKAQATVVWSEDLSDGQRYGAVVVRNPFRTADGGPRP